jgi:hypothetical protein
LNGLVLLVRLALFAFSLSLVAGPAAPLVSAVVRAAGVAADDDHHGDDAMAADDDVSDDDDDGDMLAAPGVTRLAAALPLAGRVTHDTERAPASPPVRELLRPPRIALL